MVLLSCWERGRGKERRNRRDGKRGKGKVRMDGGSGWNDRVVGSDAASS